MGGIAPRGIFCIYTKTHRRQQKAEGTKWLSAASMKNYYIILYQDLSEDELREKEK